MKKIIKITTYIAIIILTASYIMSDEVSAQTMQDYHFEGHTTQTVEKTELEKTALVKYQLIHVVFQTRMIALPPWRRHIEHKEK